MRFGSVVVTGLLALVVGAGCGGSHRGGGFIDSGARADGAMPRVDSGLTPPVDGGLPMMDGGPRPLADAGPPRPDSGVVVRPDAGPPRPDSGIVRPDAGSRPDAGIVPPLPDGGGFAMCTSSSDCAPGNDCCMLLPGIGLCLPAGSCP